MLNKVIRHVPLQLVARRAFVGQRQQLFQTI
jgi:hypothetical protein